MMGAVGGGPEIEIMVEEGQQETENPATNCKRELDELEKYLVSVQNQVQRVAAGNPQFIDEKTRRTFDQLGVVLLEITNIIGYTRWELKAGLGVAAVAVGAYAVSELRNPATGCDDNKIAKGKTLCWFAGLAAVIAAGGLTYLVLANLKLIQEKSNIYIAKAREFISLMKQNAGQKPK